MTEYDIQNALWHQCSKRGHDFPCPNVYVYEWESDFLSITKAGMVNEYEIKLTRSDFKADFTKVGRHVALRDGKRAGYSYEARKMDANGQVVLRRPNYFWYVCPDGLLVESDMPEYAGLLYVRLESPSWMETLPIHQVKRALRLHADPITDKTRGTIVVSFYWRYWRERICRAKGNKVNLG